MGKLFKLALALFLIGVGVFAIFTAISDEPIWGTFDAEEYEFNELSYDEDSFTGFDFNFSNRNFVVKVSEDDQIKVTYYTTEDEPITVTDSGDVLKLQNENSTIFTFFSNWNSIFTNDEVFDVELFLPATTVYDIDFDTSNGTFDMENMVNIDVLIFSTSNGRIDVTNCEATSMDFDTSNGKIELTNILVSGLIKMDTSNGRLLLTDVEAGEIYGDSTNQRIVAVNINCDDVHLDTSNGDVSLSIYGDKENFDVYMDTSNGDTIYDGVEVSQERFNRDADKVIYLDTSNGDVEVTFIED